MVMTSGNHINEWCFAQSLDNAKTLRFPFLIPSYAEITRGLTNYINFDWEPSTLHCEVPTNQEAGSIGFFYFSKELWFPINHVFLGGVWSRVLVTKTVDTTCCWFMCGNKTTTQGWEIFLATFSQNACSLCKTKWAEQVGALSRLSIFSHLQKFDFHFFLRGRKTIENSLIVSTLKVLITTWSKNKTEFLIAGNFISSIYWTITIRNL